MNNSFERNVGEAMASKVELDTLLSSASTADKAWLIEEAGADPDFSAGIDTHKSLSRLAVDLQEIYEERQDTVPADANTDYADIEDQAELQAIEQQYDIDAIHVMSDAIDDQIGSYTNSNGNGLTKKQQREVKRSIKQIFRESWTVEEISDNPRRLSTILNSLACNEDVSEEAREQIEGFITENVADHVKESAAATTPDIIAERLKAGFEPSPQEETLQNILIKPYFKAVQGKSCGEVLENRETFVRGVLRTREYPSICHEAMKIAKYETNLIDKKYYGAMEQLVPGIRLDQPELMGRSRAIKRALAVIETSLSESAFMDETKIDTSNIYSQAIEMQSKMLEGGLIKENLEVLKKGFGQITWTETQKAMHAIGPAEYQERIAVMDAFQSLIAKSAENPLELLSGLIDKYEENHLETATVPDTLDILIDTISNQYPNQRQFITAMVKADSIVSEELGFYIEDPRVRAFRGESMYSGSASKRIAQAAPEIDESADPADVEELFSSSISEASISNRTGDGFVIEIGVNEVPADLGQDFWNDFMEVHAEEIERAKARISEAKGLSRKYEVVFDSPVGATFAIRPETEHDRKQYHPVDELMGSEKRAEGTEQEWLALIEECKQNIIQQRRRFLSDRGIMYVEKDDHETWSIAVHKHPKNPQAFVCTVELSDDSSRKSAKIFMDSDLRFQLGDKKVRSNLNLVAFNAMAAQILEYFSCAEAVETEEGVISDEKNSVTARIAHLRLLTEGQKFSYEAWSNCLEAEGLDLEVLSRQQQIRQQTTRISTYVKAVEKDDPEIGPLRIYID